MLVKLRAMGDTLLTAAAAQALKKAAASSTVAHGRFESTETANRRREPVTIHTLVPKAWAPLLENHSAIDRVWTFDTKIRGSERLAQMFSLIANLRRENFNAVAALHASPSTAWIARLSGAHLRAVHFHGFKDKNLFSNVEIPGKGELKPILERDLDALRAIVAANKNEKLNLRCEAPQVNVRPEELNSAKTWLSEAGLASPCLAVGLGASRATKIWPVEHFAKLVSLWLERKRGSALLVCAPNEMPLAKRVLELLPAADKTRVRVKSDASLRELAALLASCEAFAGNDSGPKHLAVAVGIPTLTFFGPENPFEWHPYDRDRHRVLFTEGLECRTNVAPNGIRWCGIHECTVEKHRCMTGISPKQAIEEL